MRKIYVLDEAGKLKEIDAGITQYSELLDSPIFTTYKGVQLVGSTVALENGELKLTESNGHAWTEEELFIFCENAEGGRYDIYTEDQGYEILLIDLTKLEKLGRRYRRTGVDSDRIWDTGANDWIYISDRTARELIYKFLNEDEIKGSVVVGDPFHVKLYYYSIVGSGRVTVTMNGVSFTVGTVKSGEEIDIDLTSRIVDGENTISIKIANDSTEAFVPEITTTGINLTYTPTFNQYYPFVTDITFPYSYNGSSKKIAYFEVINAKGETNTKQESHGTGYSSTSTTLPASFFSKGENYIRTYMAAVDDNGAEITKTITTTHKIPFLTDNEPLLMSYYEDWDSLKQYASISIPYYVWSNGAITTLEKINFNITSEALPTGNLAYEYDSNDAGASINYLLCNEPHNWLISSLPTTFVGNEDKGAAFSIKGQYYVGEELLDTNTYTRENVSIESSSDALQTVAGYRFNFAASDLTRATEEWTSTGSTPKTMSLEGFNWNNDGIQIDNEGNQSLHFSSAATATLSEVTNPLFGAYNLPYTLEIDFKVSSSATEEVIAKYYNPNAANPDLYGLFIYPNKAVFKYKGGSSEINYFKGERTNLTYTICNKQITDKDPITQEEKTTNLQYLFVYINGILSQMKAINNSISFPNDCGTMKFNCNNNEFDLYAFRGYASSLSSAQILQNYISNFGRASTKEEKYVKNNVYSAEKTTAVEGEFAVSFDKVKGKIPCYVLVTDALPEDKNYNACYGIYYEADGSAQLTEWKNGISMATTYYYTRTKNEDGSFGPWIRNEKIKVGGQGTSSLAYPRKNFKFKHNDKFYIKGHTEGKDKTYTFKADYMDSSGANNIGNAQATDDAIIRSKWIGTPVATNSKLRVNLDGFPIAMFWCKSADLKGGVVQDEAIENVYDNDGITRLYDAIKVNSTNELIGEVTPEDPVYIGTFNFNYDKKAKALLGWDEKIFQGFEFRGNSSKCDLFKGFENFSAMASTSEGFEWRWTHNSDWIDDYHDGHLSLTIDGGYFDEDVKQLYTEAEYLANRKKITYVPPFNQFYIMKDGVKCQLFRKSGETYTPINYGTFDSRNLTWNITDCEGISKPSAGIVLEYGIKTAKKDGVDSLVYQLPYMLDAANPLGKAYEDGSHYYKFSWNKEHEFKFEYNDSQEYFTNVDNWTALCPLTEVKALKTVYTEDTNGTYVLDGDGLYHLLSSYPTADQEKLSGATKYTRTDTYVDVTTSDYVYTWDYMKEIFKNWCYVNEAVAHATPENFKAILDSRSTYGENGNGLFVYDALLNYYAVSVVTGLCDNFAKNMFMHSYDGGKTWSPAWYDMDTCYGLNNQGAYTKMYDIDFMDMDTSGARAFNGSDSQLWELLYNNDMDNIKTMYQTLRSNNYISYEKIMHNLYDNNIAYKAESLYNANAVYRYMEPSAWHSNNKPAAAQGNRLQLLKYWISNRQTFLDSRYEGAGWTGDIISLRLNNTEPVTFSIVPDTNMFLGANFNSGNMSVPSVKSPEKIKAGETWYCTESRSSTNKNTYIYGASHLLDVGDLSYCYTEECSIGTATNLRRLKLGDENRTSNIVVALKLSDGKPYANLQTFDLTNVKLTDTNLNFVLNNGDNLMPVLKTLKLKGSNIEMLTLGNYTPIEYISYPDNIKEINLKNLLFLSNVNVYGIDSLESINMINCPSLNQISVLNKVVNKNIAIHADNLQCGESNSLTMDYMNWLYNINAELGGSIYVQSIADGNLKIYRDRWPNLTINLHQIYAKDVIFGVTGEGDTNE